MCSTCSTLLLNLEPWPAAGLVTCGRWVKVDSYATRDKMGGSWLWKTKVTLDVSDDQTWSDSPITACNSLRSRPPLNVRRTEKINKEYKKTWSHTYIFSSRMLNNLPISYFNLRKTQINVLKSEQHTTWVPFVNKVLVLIKQSRITGSFGTNEDIVPKQNTSTDQPIIL